MVMTLVHDRRRKKHTFVSNSKQDLIAGRNESCEEGTGGTLDHMFRIRKRKHSRHSFGSVACLQLHPVCTGFLSVLWLFRPKMFEFSAAFFIMILFWKAAWIVEIAVTQNSSARSFTGMFVFKWEILAVLVFDASRRGVWLSCCDDVTWPVSARICGKSAVI